MIPVDQTSFGKPEGNCLQAALARDHMSGVYPQVPRPVLRYHGAKWRIAPWIIANLPRHLCYVEPFGGAASVLLRKPPSKIEVLNDADQRLMRFFRTLREREADLVRAIDLTPYSRAEFEAAFEPADDPVEDARRVFVLCWQGRSRGLGEWRTGWRYEINGRRNARAVDDFRADHLPAVVARLKHVQLECDAAAAVIARYDSPATLHYCLAPGTLIRTANERLVPIEQIQVGEVLFGGRVVQQRFERVHRGDLLSLTVQGVPDALRLTPDHRVVRIPKRTAGRQETRTPEGLWCLREEVAADYLEPGDYVLVPVGGSEAPVPWKWSDEPRRTGVRVSTRFQPGPESLRFLGYYAAEGHVHRQRGHPVGVVLSFGAHETTTWVPDAQRCVRHAFGVAAQVRPGPSSASVAQVCVWSTSVTEFVARYVTGTATDKALDPALLTVPVSEQRELLIGWFRGDGGFHVESRNRGRLCGTTASQTLARQMFLIALRCGLRPRMRHRTGWAWLHGRRMLMSAWDVILASEDAAELGWAVPARRFRSTRKIVSGHILARIRSISRSPYEGPVFDLDVNGDNLFAVPFVLVHNCDPPYVWETRSKHTSKSTARYATELDEAGHRALAEQLHRLAGMVVLSGYPSPLYVELYEAAGWRRLDRACLTDHGFRTECLWFNPAAAAALPQQDALL